MSIAIEDNAADVLRKSMLGRGISSEMLAEATGVPLAQIRSLRNKRADSQFYDRVARYLNLCPEKLSLLDRDFEASRAGDFFEEAQLPVNCFREEMFCGNKVLPEMMSNAYMITDDADRHAVLFDCGMDATPLVDRLNARGIKSVDVCLTHRHFDHAGGLKDLENAFPQIRVFEFNTFFADSGKTEADFTLRRFSVKAISVPGHTPDSVVFVWQNPPCAFPPIAFTGDTIFFGSVGGCMPGDLELSLESIRERLFKRLAGKTVLAPGHGPATTLAREACGNPFF